PFENATRARWGRRRAIRKERRRDSVRAHVEEVRRGGWPAAAPNPKGWSGNGHRAASLVVDSRDKACLLLVPCAVAVPGPARSCGVLRRSLARVGERERPRLVDRGERAAGVEQVVETARVTRLDADPAGTCRELEPGAGTETEIERVHAGAEALVGNAGCLRPELARDLEVEHRAQLPEHVRGAEREQPSSHQQRHFEVLEAPRVLEPAGGIAGRV